MRLRSRLRRCGSGRGRGESGLRVVGAGWGVGGDWGWGVGGGIGGHGGGGLLGTAAGERQGEEERTHWSV